MFVDDGVKGQPITPGRGEVSNVDITVASRLHLTPQEKCIFGGFCLLAINLFKSDVLNLNKHSIKSYLHS